MSDAEAVEELQLCEEGIVGKAVDAFEDNYFSDGVCLFGVFCNYAIFARRHCLWGRENNARER